jgi:putative acetyltransferase
MSRIENPSPILVRFARIEEAAIIAALLLEAFGEYEPLYTAGGFAATTPTSEQIRARWSDGPVWIVQQTGRAVGTVAAVPKSQGVYVRSMAVHPEARGQGVGRLLLEQVEDFARQRDCKRMFLSTTPFLQGAIRLYEQFGFVWTGDGPEELEGTPLLTMEKALSVAAVPPM